MNNQKKNREASQELVFSETRNRYERRLFCEQVNPFHEITVDDVLAGEPGGGLDQTPDDEEAVGLMSPREVFLYYRAGRDAISLEGTQKAIESTRDDFEESWALLEQLDKYVCYQNVEEKEQFLRDARSFFRSLNALRANLSLTTTL